MNKTKIIGVRIVIAGIILFFVLFVIIKIFVDESKVVSTSLINNQTIFIAVWVIIILFTLTFLFILIRNIVKLYFGKEEGKVGGKIKSRLIFFFIAFTIVPVLLLFIFATELIDRGIDKWFNMDIESIMEKTNRLKTSYYDKAKEDLEHFARTITFQKTGIKDHKRYTYNNKDYLANYLQENMMKYGLDVVNVYRNEKELVSRFSAEIPLQEYKDLPKDMVYRGLSGSQNLFSQDSMKSGELIRAGIDFDINKGQDKVLVIIGKYYPDEYIKNLKELNLLVNQYNQLNLIKKPVKTTYILLFIFITILVVFSASWVGLYLARGITIPIEKLESAASEIAKGNLSVKIEYKAKNEFNSLIQKFNTMVMDLKENREKLSRRTDELRQGRSLTETILNSITSGVIAIDFQGNILEVNPGAERMLSFSETDKLGQHYSNLFHGDSLQELRELIKKAYDTKFKLTEKELDVKSMGKILNLAVKITHIKNPVDNKFGGIIVVLTDLTELIRAEKMLVWREIAKRIAHEIKNPLTPIQISSQRIIKSLELDDKKFRKIVEDSLGIINSELNSIKKMADEFSNFARLPEVKFSKGDINQILEKLVTVYTSIYNNINFKVNLDVDIPILIKMDPEQMKRIFVNIIDNSVKAMEEKGSMEIVSKYIAEAKFIRIEIADNGPGISEDDKHKLFVPYFSKSVSGTGLGLTIAHNIVQEHNGKISCVDNSPGGIRFIIEIPA